MNAASLPDHLRKALEEYHDLEALSRSPLQSLQAIWDTEDIAPAAPGMPWEGLALRALLDRALYQLGTSLPDQRDLLDLRFRQQLPMKEVERRLHLRQARLFERINQALVSLAAVVVEMENRARLQQTQRRQIQLAALPVIEGQPIGVEAAVAEVRTRLGEQLAAPGMPLLVAGLGGIGKTTLVLEAVRSWVLLESPLIQQVLWVTVNSSLFMDNRVSILTGVLSSLASQLSLSLAPFPTPEAQLDHIARYLSSRVRQYVLVIDNIESKIDTQVARQIANAVRNYIPLVLTSRQAFDLERGGMRLLSVHELPEPNAKTLIAQEADRLNVPPLPDSEIQAIYDAIGGHPLSIKLVVAQRRFLPLSQIFAMFGARSELATKMFTNIYAVTWTLLTDVAEAVLTGLTLLPPSGGFWETVVANVEVIHPNLPPQDLGSAIQLLTQLNLLQLTYTAKRQQVYSLHRLTYQYIERRGGMEMEEE